jgi:starch phosphorylase
MKAVCNGAIHLSTLDGWWAEAYSPEVGWAIGKGEDYGSDTAYQDEVEGDALYDLLERQIVPLFFKRNIAQLPLGWVELMKRSMATLVPRFASHRMVREYVEKSYLPAHASQAALVTSNYAGARQLAQWRTRVQAAWGGVHIESAGVGDSSGEMRVGDTLQVEAVLSPGALAAGDLAVEAYHGQVTSTGEMEGAEGDAMELVETLPDGKLRYRKELTLPDNGYYGVTVRVYPNHPLLGNRFALAKMAWAPAPPSAA